MAAGAAGGEDLLDVGEHHRVLAAVAHDAPGPRECAHGRPPRPRRRGRSRSSGACEAPRAAVRTGAWYAAGFSPRIVRRPGGPRYAQRMPRLASVPGGRPAQVADHDVERPLQRLDLAGQQQLGVQVGAGPGGGAERAPERAVGGDRQLREELGEAGVDARSPAPAHDRGPRSAARCDGRRRRRASGAARTAAAARRRPRPRASTPRARSRPCSTSRGIASTTRREVLRPAHRVVRDRVRGVERDLDLESAPRRSRAIAPQQPLGEQGAVGQQHERAPPRELERELGQPRVQERLAARDPEAAEAGPDRLVGQPQDALGLEDAPLRAAATSRSGSSRT